MQEKNAELTLVAIGASTGGPNALCELFSKIPVGLNAAYFIVQHLPIGFTEIISKAIRFAFRFDS